MEVNELIGKRVLLKGQQHGKIMVEEFKILEISPSGVWIKVLNQYGIKQWKAKDEIFLVEVLLTVEKPKN
jgi:hypothetical protein